jgi:hypothetical protein
MIKEVFGICWWQFVDYEFGAFLRGVFWVCRSELEQHMYVDYVKEQDVGSIA